MDNKIIIAALTTAVLTSACAIKQDVQPVSLAQASEMCVIENTKVKDEFLSATVQSLTNLGYSTKMLPDSSGVGDCNNVLTYTANWTWDVAIYMTFAKFEVYKNGSKVGSAEYDSRAGSANMSKFIQAEAKVKELISELFVQ